jgi:O-succinylbenzoic acid--CoA ligase
MRVANWLLRADPSAPAVNSLTYGELLERARAAALPAGERIGIALPAGEDFAVALHAAWLRGAVGVPHDLRLPPERRPDVDAVVEGPLELGPPVEPREIDLDAPAVLMQTSGTTGTPRPVELTFGNLLWSALGSAVALGVDPRERWLGAMPLSHVGGLSILVRSAIYGTHAVLHDGWDSERVMAEDATLISVVPTMLARLLDAGWRGSDRLRWVLIGGAPLPARLRGQAEAAGLPIAETYGLTEASSQVTTFGIPLFCTQVEISQEGEILVSGPTVAGGGMLATGDLGRWSRDGRLEVTGRRSELIISGGENVSPVQVEAALESHEAVAEAMVYGAPDDEWGQAVHATVVLAGGASATEDQLRDHCTALLARFQIPKRIDFAGELPRTGSGKLVRPRR